MLQQLTITTTDKTALKPLVESAIEREKEMLSLAIRRTRERLAEFERRLNALELQETVELADWRMEIGALRLLESQHRTPQDDQMKNSTAGPEVCR